MISKINIIRGVGKFLNVTQTELGKVTLIYGLNCYGKSTLADVFRSLANQDLDILNKRKSILKDKNDIAQEIVFAIKNDDTSYNVYISDNKWNLNNFNYNIEIFDSRFIEDNIFTGSVILRDNEENLTNLLLGENSVKVGNEIIELKKEIKSISKKINENEDNIKKTLKLSNIDISLDKFLKIEKLENIEECKIQKDKIKKQIERINKSYLEQEKIRKIGKPKELEIEDPINIIYNFKDLLKQEFKFIREDAYNLLLKHIKNNFRMHDGEEESWIKEGVNKYLKVDEENNINNSKCPFCGQSLNYVDELIKTYLIIFSQEYEKYCKNLFNNIENNYNRFDKYINNIKNYDKIISNNLSIILSYGIYLNDNFNQQINNINTLGQELIEYTSNFINIMVNILSEFKNIIEEKQKKPYRPINQLPFLNNLTNTYNNYMGQIKNYNLLITDIKNNIDVFVNQINDNEYNNKINKLNDSLIKIQEKILRYDLAEDIDNLVELREKKNEKEKKYYSLQEKLSKDNEEFTTQYFKEMTEIFQNLGSVDFDIYADYNRRGYQPVYKLKFKYNDKEIKPELIPYFFSESDRRALAFSIFLSRLKKMDKNKLKHTIVIFDDPITSFDDNRISNSIRYIELIKDECRQLIITSHYSMFLKNIYSNWRKDPNLNLKFLEIIRDKDGCIFKTLDNPNTRLDPYAQEIEKIEKFIEGDSSISANEVRRTLRPMLEKEIKWRFRKQLQDKEFSGLGEIIKFLSNYTTSKNYKVKHEVIKKMNSFNKVLREDYHQEVNTNSEDTRKLARDILDFVFIKLNPLNS